MPDAGPRIPVAVPVWPEGGRGWRAAAVLVAFASTAWLLRRLPAQPADVSHGPLALLWILALASYAAAFVRPGRAAAAAWLARVRANRGVIAAVTGLTLLGLLLRVWRLDSIPFVFSGDEAGQGLETLRVLSGEIRNPFSTGRLSMPTATFFYNSLGVRLCGPEPGCLRLPWAAIGTLTVPVAYCLAARLTNRSLGLVTAALLAVYHYHIHFSRLALNNIADPLLCGLALLSLFRALDDGRPSDWVWTGLVCGLALYGYPGARATLVVAGAVVVHAALRMPARDRPWTGIAIALGAFLLAAAPMLQHAVRFPDEFNGRMNQVGILQSGWLAREAGARDQSAATILADQFQRAALAFNVHPDTSAHYGLREPLLDPVFGAIFVLGLLYGTARVLLQPGHVRLGAMVVWWWAGTILGGVLTEMPPVSARLVTLTIPVCFFCALALWIVLQRARRYVRLPVRSLLAAAAALFAAISVHQYFVRFTPLRISGGRHAELATELAPVLNRRTPPQVYFLGAPEMYAGFPSVPYLMPRVPFEDVLDPLSSQFTRELTLDRDAVFVVLPSRAADLAQLREAYPAGTVREIRSGADAYLLGTLFFVPRVSDPVAE
jgi:hypothetical protein